MKYYGIKIEIEGHTYYYGKDWKELASTKKLISQRREIDGVIYGMANLDAELIAKNGYQKEACARNLIKKEYGDQIQKGMKISVVEITPELMEIINVSNVLKKLKRYKK